MKKVRYLIDSDILADWLRGKEQAVQLITSVNEQNLAISIITYGEIYEGVYYGADRPKHELGLQSFLKEVDVLPLPLSVMKRFAQLRGQLRAAGNLIGDFDLLIAATALHYKLTLITRNKRHYGRIPDLSLYQPE